MSDIVNAQQEFEVLIDQLEKLKKVNEITSQNTQSSANLIKVLKTFMKELSPFLEKVNKNHDQIVAQVKGTLNSLEESLTESKTVNKETQSIVADHLSKVESDLKEIKTLEDSTQDKLSRLMEGLKKIMGETQKIQEKQLKSEATLVNTMNRVGESVTEVKTYMDTEFKQQGRQLKSIKIMMGLILILVIAGFAGLAYLMQPF